MTAKEIIPTLLQACPEFRPTWEQHLAHWGNDERGDYIDMSAFAHFLIDSYKSHRRECLPKAFQSIEDMLHADNDEVYQLLTVGLLEDILVISSHMWRNPFPKWLGPKSKSAWLEIEKTWEGKSTLADVIRAERNNQQSGAR